MNAASQKLSAPASGVARLRAETATDLLTLALLHERELDPTLILTLWEHCYEEFLGLRLQGRRACEALILLREGLTDLPADLQAETLDRLAADYADIYLTYGLRASPCESVWLDDDNLTMQEPTFCVRDWYRRHGIAVADWRKRNDDHLVHQLRFIAHLLDGAEPSVELAEIARFLDEHPLRWIERFAERVAAHCATRFYAGLALLTAAYLDELRDLLTSLGAAPRPSPEELAARSTPARRPQAEAEGPYAPGAAPGW